jgi:hypothetical protein
MQKVIVVKGRLINPTTIKLDEPVSESTGEVEVILLLGAREQASKGETVLDWQQHSNPVRRNTRLRY